MKKFIYAIAVVPLLLTLCDGQDPSSSTLQLPFNGLTQQQMDRRIFASEHAMISGLRYSHPLLETYIQSEWPKAKVQSPIDDAYFLSLVDFARGCCVGDRGRRGHLTMLFGGEPESKKIKVDNGGKWELYPDGYLDMLFVDLESFDADTYSLFYLQLESCNDLPCLSLLVHPKVLGRPGRFDGRIWVETSTFKIVRIKGTFTSPRVPLFTRIFGGTIPFYVSFDTIREEVSPGKWLPSYVYFDENRTWKQLDHNGETDFHYRGHTFIWGYFERDYNENENTPAVIQRVANGKVIAAAGETEQALDTIVNQILIANQLNADIRCRVLLSTPIELFNVGHTIFISRGLLNTLPDNSALPALLAYEIASIRTFGKTSTQNHRKSLWNETANLVSRSQYSNSLEKASVFIAQLSEHAKQIPNLLRSRFGPSLLSTGSALMANPNGIITGSSSPLVLRGKYTIEIEDGSLRTLDSPRGTVSGGSNPEF